MGEPCEGRTTHHAGCACHEARRDAQLAAVTAERDGLRAQRNAVIVERDRALSIRDGRSTILSARRDLGATDDEGLREAAQRVTRERDALRAERDGEHDLIARQAAILTAVADALKGTPPALSSHSHHDLGAVAAATVAQQAPLVACVDALRAAATAAGWRDADATGETLVAWVRRGALLDAARIALERGGERVAKAIVARANEEGGG